MLPSKVADTYRIGHRWESGNAVSRENRTKREKEREEEKVTGYPHNSSLLSSNLCTIL